MQQLTTSLKFATKKILHNAIFFEEPSSLEALD